MKHVVVLIFFIIGFQAENYSQAYEIKDNIKRIVFLGNSITYQGGYIDYIDTYLSIKYPEKNYEIINVGLPSETVSGLSEPNHAKGAFPRPDLHERLDRILTKTKPDLVLACYGMNDGIFMPYDDNRFKKYKDGVNWLHDKIKKFGAEIIHITPPIYDEQKGKAYANVLDIYANWLISNRYTSNWNVIDIHSPMKKNLEKQRLLDSTFVFAKDGIHPNKKGHFLIAKHILIYLGQTEFTKIDDIKSFLSTYQNGKKILSHVEKKQAIMKDAWLTSIGHLRPRMKLGLPIDEARQNTIEIEKQIRLLLKKE
ncbi:SGNH/GDSL hydrolase family protein [Polaribacter staleyi]|uniref:SGNH/GDSL hydrolase family protein n=1 Tax=Polaribacter staleyi TaxID=2022337 RepID=UPI0031BAD250